MNAPLVSRFVVLTHEFWPFRGGVATYCAELANAGHTGARIVEVWTPGSVREHPFPFSVRWLGGGTRLHPWDLLRLAASLVRYRSELEGRGVVLASVGAQMAWMLARRLVPFRGTPVLVVFHGSEILKFQRRRWWQGMVTQLIRSSCRVICVSGVVEFLFRESPWGDLQSVVRRAPGAPSSSLRQRAQEKRSIPRRDDGMIRLLTLARIHPRKGQRETAQALGLLPEEWKARVEYWIAGKGSEEYATEVRGFLASAGVRAKWFGEVSEEKAAELYAACDLFIMSSRSEADSVEGLGITYLEAGDFGKPSVGFRSGGVEEAVVHGETGLLAREGDIAELSSSILTLVRDAELRERMGRAARNHSGRFDWRNTAKMIFE